MGGETWRAHLTVFFGKARLDPALSMRRLNFRLSGVSIDPIITSIWGPMDDSVSYGTGLQGALA